MIKKNKEIQNFIKNNIKELLFSLMIVIFTITVSIDYITYGLHNAFKFMFVVFVCVIELVLLFLAKKKKLNTEKIYLLIIIPIGTFFLLNMPISEPPDEFAHFCRAYEISYGHLLSDKNKDGVGGRVLTDGIEYIFKNRITLNSNIISEIKNVEKIKTKSFKTYPGSALYSPVSYIPQVLGILIGRILGLPLLCIVYFARLFNFIICVMLTYYAIKILPHNKNIMFIIALLPMTIQGECSIQADGFTNAISFLFISVIIANIYKKQALNYKEKTLISVLAILLSLLKIVYMPLCLLVFLLPKECFNNNKKKKLVQIFSLAFIVVTLNLVWLKISSTFLINSNSNTSSSSQVIYILNNTFMYGIMMLKTFGREGLDYLMNIFGSSLGSFNIPQFETFLFIAFLSLMACVIKDDDKLNLSNNSKWLSGCIVLIIIALIYTSLFVQWTGASTTYISGVQGRYFIPILPLLMFIFMKKDNKRIKTNMLYETSLICLFLNIYSVLSIINYAY